jgi:putative transposase
MHDKHQIIEEPCNGKLLSTVLKTSGAGDSLAEFNSFLTCSEGFKVESPEFLKSSLNVIRKASEQHSKKLKGSANRERARKHLVRQHEKVSFLRRDWFWKLAHELTNQFDVLCFETLNLKGMQRLWGRKVNDLALGDFLQVLEWVAKKKGKRIVYVDRWYPSSKTCSCCGHVLDELDLSVRRWRCPSCHSVNDRDENAAINICMVGSSTLGVGDVRQPVAAIPF